MFSGLFTILRNYFHLSNRHLWAILALSAAGANVASEPLAAVPLLPAELSTLVTAAVRNHPVVQSAQAKKRAALQDVEAAERSKWPTLTATNDA